jgi:beta-galactosidase/beta-glucuronidase
MENDKTWKKTDVSIDTWAALNLSEYYGPVWYRAQVDVPQAPSGKKIYLWVGATDGLCKVFVNGQHVPYRNTKGEESAEANGYCQPFSFDITAAVKAGGKNQIVIRGARTFINELGTGGLLGPVVIYTEKDTDVK